MMLAPLAANAEEAVGSMGNDTPLAVLSDRRPLLYSYFKQLFAQVTNPPIDPIREAVVMSKQSLVGSGGTPRRDAEHARQLVIDNPILRDEELERLRQVDSDVFRAHTIDCTWAVADGAAAARAGARGAICADADAALAAGRERARALRPRRRVPTASPVPSLLAVSAIHHHLVRAGTRLQAGLVVESGEPRSVQSVAVLIGYGAAAVNPYVMLATIRGLVDEGRLDLGHDEAEERAVAAVGKGLLKTISKMGISTLSSYCGAQVFEAVGLAADLVERHFTGTPSRIGGIGLARARRGCARPPRPRVPGSPRRAAAGRRALRVAARRRAPPVEPRDDRPPAARRPRRRPADVRAVRGRGQRRLARAARRCAGLLRLRERDPISLDEVEPAIRDRQALLDRRDVARLALARGARDARGRDEPDRRPLEHRRGREDPERFLDERRSKIKQVASGRFGVNIDYLVNADELQIKMAQGAKPGEGGQLPRPQGRPVHRVDPLHDAGRGAHLAAAAPRHLLDRGSEAARSTICAARTPTRASRSSSSPRWASGRLAAGVAKCNADAHPHRGSRRRHRRLADLVDPARRRPWEIGSRGDAADARAERPALARVGADRRAAQDGPRRRRSPRCSAPTRWASRRRR